MQKKILIVDDEKDNAYFLAENLRMEGFEVILAYDGIEAKDKILKEKPEVIILDLIMPRLDGWGVLEWLRKEAKLNTPTIIVSAKGELDDMKKGYGLEADTYLIKPVTVNDVLRGISIVCSLESDEK
ncbi:MAG: response regulator [Candidatus Omnitrophica bacterium]|jgi:two-component system response regulator VicR|nr:response regulator [Candidatus Omnitrophota bacterium]